MIFIVFRFHPGVVGQGLIAASNISCGRGIHGEKASKLLLSLKFDKLLIDLLEIHSDNEALLGSCLSVTAHMTKLNPNEWKYKLIKSHIPELVLNILNDHPNVSNIQLWGLVVMANTVTTAISIEKAAASSQIKGVLIGFATTLIEALKNHSKNPAIVGQVNICTKDKPIFSSFIFSPPALVFFLF